MSVHACNFVVPLKINVSCSLWEVMESDRAPACAWLVLEVKVKLFYLCMQRVSSIYAAIDQRREIKRMRGEEVSKGEADNACAKRKAVLDACCTLEVRLGLALALRLEVQGSIFHHSAPNKHKMIESQKNNFLTNSLSARKLSQNLLVFCFHLLS